MTLRCPVCTGRIRVMMVEVTVDGDTKTTVIKGACEACGTGYTLTKREYLVRDVKWHTRR
jgi:C4-type Zn-finger protein